MSQMPMPGYPAQPQPQYPGYPPQQAPAQYAPVPAQYAQPGFPPGFQQPPAAPPVQLAPGTLDDFYSQPSTGGGPSISWSHNGYPKPEGTAYAGIVARDVTSADIQQQTDPKTGQPKFYRDGRPQFVMKVPLKVVPSQEFPEGDAVLFVRGQMRDELVRAMTEVGANGAPKGGDQLLVTLVQRKPARGGGVPMNVFSVQYKGGAGAPAPVAATVAPSPVPVAQPVAPQFPAQQAPQFQAPVQPQAPQFPAQPVQQAPAQFQAPVQQAPQFPAQPAAPAQAPLVMPAGLNADQAALFAQLTGNAGQ